MPVPRARAGSWPVGASLSRLPSHRSIRWAGALLLGLATACGDSPTEAGPATGVAAVPAAPKAAGDISVSLTSVADRGDAGPAYQVLVSVRDAGGDALAGAPIGWRTLTAGDSVAGPAVTDADGQAVLTWVPRGGASALQVLEVSAAPLVSARLALMAPSGAGAAPVPVSLVDTVRAILPDVVRLRITDLSGKPVAGASVRVLGDGSPVATRDDGMLASGADGTIRAGWQLGPKAGAQTLTIEVPGPQALRVEDVASGQVALLGKPLRIARHAAPGRLAVLHLARQAIHIDAVGDTFTVVTTGEDAYGNPVLPSPARYASRNPAVVSLSPAGLPTTSAPGTAWVHVLTDGMLDSVLVTVDQRPASITFTVPRVRLNFLGAQAGIDVLLHDRLGSPIADKTPTVRSLSPSKVMVAPTGDAVVGLVPGRGAIEARIDSIADTLVVQVVQVPVEVWVSLPRDTMDLDGTQPLGIQVFDSARALIASPRVTVSFEDPSVARVDTTGTLTATLPGVTSVVVEAGTVADTAQLVVEGVALLADGRRNPTAAELAVARDLLLTNGRVRLHWHPRLGERGGMEMDTRVGRAWIPANVRGAGDWLYVTSTVLTEPTGIFQPATSPNRVAVSMRFGNHIFDPILALYPSWYRQEPFPFTRTVWLEARDYGYYSWTQLERTMSWVGTELEVGFGGMFGPARIRTGAIDFRTDAMTRHRRFNVASVPDAAEFDLDNDPLYRVLVPLPEAPMISPVFPGWGYGSVYVHRSDYQSYGAYMYAPPRGQAASARNICLRSWQEAPFPLRALTPAEMANCGPP